MKKQLKVALVTSAAILAVAGLANATTPLQVNLVGASAEFDYWAGGTTPAMPAFLTSALGCTAGPLKTIGKFAYVKGTACDPAKIPAGYGNEIEFRVTGQATVESTAIKGTPAQYPSVVYVTDDATNYPCNDTHKRTFVIDGSLNTSGTNSGKIKVGCLPAHIGALDLDASSVTQLSSGQVFGPMGGGAVSFDHTGGLDMSGMTHLTTTPGNFATTFATPFALSVNKAVKARQCTAGNIGDVCTADSDCGSGGTCNTTSTTINNLSRLQVAMIFSGQTASWRDFGPAYDDIATVACLRHSGSGTAACFDNMVMTGGTSGWGATTATTEVATVDGPPIIYFNDSTGAELGCANGNTTADASGNPSGTGADIGGVAYADADKAVGSGTGLDKLVQIKYNGVRANANNIKNGSYDWYSIANFYANPAYADQSAVAAKLIDYISNGTIPTNKATYWAQAKDMVFKRGSDLVYPTRQ